jgi:hypothetical protein
MPNLQANNDAGARMLAEDDSYPARAARYSAEAADCRERASKVLNPKSRDTYLKLAASYEDLAKQILNAHSMGLRPPGAAG